LDELPGHRPDSPLMLDFAGRIEWFHPPSTDRSWLGRGRGATFAEMVELAARALDPGEPVDLAVMVTSTSDSGEVGYPGGLLRHLLPGEPLLLGITEQGAAGPFTALRIAADRIAAGAAERAVVLVMEQCRLPAEPGVALPARDRALLLVLGPSGTHVLRTPQISRTRPTEPVTGRVLTPTGDGEAHGCLAGDGVAGDGAAADGAAGDVDPGEEGITGVWAALAERWPGLAGEPVTLAVRDSALSYWCRLELDPVPTEFGASPAESAHSAVRRVGV
jgi:hypothetical protein